MRNFETKAGVTIAIFAALMSISDLFAGKYGDDEIIGTNEKAAAYQWYQSKSIKASLVEGQHDLLNSLLDAKVINEQSLPAMKIHIDKLKNKLERYEKEKKEILLGSKAVGEQNWIQDVEGQLGQVVGAKELDSQLSVLSKAGDKFDLASLFYQMCLVLGAIALVLKQESLQDKFYYLMTGVGCLGMVYSLLALRLVLF